MSRRAHVLLHLVARVMIRARAHIPRSRAELQSFLLDFIHGANPHSAACVRRRTLRELPSLLLDEVRVLLERSAHTGLTITASPGIVGHITPLAFLAQWRCSRVLKQLFQCGHLERESRPSNVLLSILFSPPRLEEAPDKRSHTQVVKDVEDCMALCFRVLTHISIADIELQVIHGCSPLLEDWRVFIPPSRYQQPCELTHLCRVAIRRTLMLTGGLPDSIKTLPLPTYLKNYLNLEH
ncbi:hypothetical protein SRHO_G00209640 [Serrasalmus rhombeus]